MFLQTRLLLVQPVNTTSDLRLMIIGQPLKTRIKYLPIEPPMKIGNPAIIKVIVFIIPYTNVLYLLV